MRVAIHDEGRHGSVENIAHTLIQLIVTNRTPDRRRGVTGRIKDDAFGV